VGLAKGEPGKDEAGSLAVREVADGRGLLAAGETKAANCASHLLELLLLREGLEHVLERGQVHVERLGQVLMVESNLEMAVLADHAI